MKKIIVSCILTVAMMATLCSCGGDDSKTKADGAASSVLNSIGQSVIDAGKKVSDNVEDIDKTDLKVDPDIDGDTDAGDDSAVVDPDSDDYLGVGVEEGLDKETLGEITGLVEGLLQKYPEGDVTVQQILDEIGNDDLAEVINDILTDPMDIPDDEKPAVIVHIDELLTKLQDVANEMIEGPMDKMAR